MDESEWYCKYWQKYGYEISWYEMEDCTNAGCDCNCCIYACGKVVEEL